MKGFKGMHLQITIICTRSVANCKAQGKGKGRVRQG